MRVVLLFFAILALTGCEQVMVVKRGVDTVFAAGASAYCRLPEEARRLNRERIAAKIHPNRIEIICAREG